jgi:hypothetical protein
VWTFISGCSRLIFQPEHVNETFTSTGIWYQVGADCGARTGMAINKNHRQAVVEAVSKLFERE